MSELDGELAPADARPVGSIRGSVVKGVFWTVAARGALRGLGLVSTILLARLLMPQDFGLIAMAMVVLGFLDVLFSQGVDTALIQNASATRAHWDTAWTIRVLQGAGMTAVLIVLAPLASRYYGEPRMMTIMPILAIGTFATSLENIGPVAYRKDLQFHRDFQFMVAKKLLQFVIVLGLAVVWRDYRALMLGMVFGGMASTCLSYALHPFRPKWSLAKATEIWGFSFRLAAVSFATYVNTEGEKLVIGAIAGAEQTGIYYVGDEIAELPASELTAPISRVAISGFAKLRPEPDRLHSAFLKILEFVTLLAVPAAAGLFVIADDVVAVFLGPRWIAAGAVIRLCAISGGLRAIYNPCGNFLMVTGRLNLIIAINFFHSLLFVSSLLLVVGDYGILGAASVKSAVATVSFVLYVRAASRAVQVSIIEILAVLWRPLASAIMMVLACLALSGVFTSPIAELACRISVGAICYGLVIYTIWLASGRPDGAERDLLEMALDRARTLCACLPNLLK
jgi:O-antigen/teichoic acid export membrane protein